MRTCVLFVRLSVLTCTFLCITFASLAQSISSPDGKIEIGIGVGPMIFLGDLGGSAGVGKTFIKDVDLPMTKISKGIYFNIYPTEWLGFRLAGNLGYLQGDDAQAPDKGGDEWFRKKRNLKFESKLSEAYFATEIYPTVFFEQYDGLAGKFRPYGLGGVGVFHFNPKGEFIESNGNKKMVELKPLRLEGQGMAEYPDRKEYSLTQLEIVMGGGFKYYLTDGMYVGFEILHRKTFTDYIDDVSTTYIDPALFNNYLRPEQIPVARQLMFRENIYNPSVSRVYTNEQRGDPKENDAFFSGILRFGWRLNGMNTPNGRAKRQLKCPVYY
ncbi:MAG TPA: hypothetical protein VFV31_02265 [Chitinophagaceae bacterium]|nr:hypothetical protein [Chitinophagaceae bacterium]